MALKQQGQKLSSFELYYLHPIGLENAWKILLHLGGKIKNGPLAFLYFWSHFQDVKIFSSHIIDARSVNNPDLLNLHSLVHHLDRNLTPVNSI